MMIKILLFTLSNLSFANEEFSLTSYLECHREYDQLKIRSSDSDEQTSKCINDFASKTPPAITRLSRDLGLETYLKYYLREKNLTESDEIFFDNCNNARSIQDMNVGKIAEAVYDISFLDRNKPDFENQTGQVPEGFSVEKFYGNNPDECYNTGFKAAQFRPTSGDYIIFGITGTEGSDTFSNGKKRELYKKSKEKAGLLSIFSKSEAANEDTLITANEKDKEDWGFPTGVKQLNSACAKELVEDALKLALKEKKKIIFTGHSLGGALAEAMSYQLTAKLDSEDKNVPRVKAVTFMSAGGLGHIKRAKKEILDKIDATNYISIGDIVPTLGNHIGEIRGMKRKDEYENKFKSREFTMLDAHTLKFERFHDLKESKYLTGQELSKVCSDFTNQCFNPEFVPEK